MRHAVARIQPLNIATGIGVLAVYAYGVVDRILGYRRQSRDPLVQPFVTTSPDGSSLGITVPF